MSSATVGSAPFGTQWRRCGATLVALVMLVGGGHRVWTDPGRMAGAQGHLVQQWVRVACQSRRPYDALYADDLAEDA